ncbi:hypothetical protein AALB39_15295 [Lachnospiraceae bacterium 54-53]
MNKPEYKSCLKDIFMQFIGYKKLSGRKERLYISELKTFNNYCVLHSKKYFTTIFILTLWIRTMKSQSQSK